MNEILSRTEIDQQSSQSDYHSDNKSQKRSVHLQNNALSPLNDRAINSLSNQNKLYYDKYSPTSQLFKKCLPAGFSHQPIYGQLMLNVSPVIFDSNAPISKSKHVIYRCHMLGYDKRQQPLFQSEILYSIHTNCKMFKSYLKDMKVCVIDVLDSRNYQPIGHICVNWLTHLRSVVDQQFYLDQPKDNQSKSTIPLHQQQQQQNLTNAKRFYLPFIDEECKITLPVYDYRNPKNIPIVSPKNNVEKQKCLQVRNNPRERIIGQVEVNFVSRVYHEPILPGYNQNQQQQIPILHNNRVSDMKSHMNPSQLQIPNQARFSGNDNPISLKNLLPDKRVSAYTVKVGEQMQNQVYANLRKQGSSISSQIQKSQHLLFKQSQRSTLLQGHKLNQHRGSHIYQLKHATGQNLLLNQHSANRNLNKNLNTMAKTNQLQLIKLKMQARDFFNPNQLIRQEGRQSEKMIVSIFRLKSKLQNIKQLDVYICDVQDQSEANHKSTTTPKFLKTKIYRLQTDRANNLDYFRSKIIVDDFHKKRIQIQLPNNQGKGTVKCRDLIQQKNIDVFIYSKGLIVGVLTVTKQDEQKKIIPTKDVTIEIAQKTKNQQAILHEPKEDKICIIQIDNFTQHFHKNYDISGISHLDNYFISIKSIHFYHETLLNSSKSIGQYAITNSLSMPKVFAVEVKNSGNQFVGMSENIQFEGNEIKLIDKNIMPMLILERNLTIQLKQSPAFKKLPNSISFRMSVYVCNTVQLNFFINKWRQNQNKTKILQNKRQKSYSNVNRQINVNNVNLKTNQKLKEKQYTISDQGISEVNVNQKRVRTESEDKYSGKINKYTESKSSHARESDKSRFKTQGNYTEDIQNRTQQNQQHTSQIKQNEQNYSEHSQRQNQSQYQQHQQQQIYLVEFFSKSLHYILSRLGSKKVIQQKIRQLTNFDRQQNLSTTNNGGLISKEEFHKVLQIFIGSLGGNINHQHHHQQLLGFDVNQILQALFVDEDGERIKIKQFTLCLMAYYNFLLLLTNQKLTAFKELVQCEPQVESKLSRIQQSMTNISSQFLWEDVLPNTLQKTKKKINKRYRIYANTPFSVHFLLKDLTLAIKDIQHTSDQLLFTGLLNILTDMSNKKQQLFMRTTADLGNLVRETVEQIIFSQFIVKASSSQINFENKNWFQLAQKVMQSYVLKQNNLQSMSSNEQKNEYCFNLTQFQQYLKQIGIDTSIWQSLMLIQQIKVWNQYDFQSKDREFVDIGEGVITCQLLRKWLGSLKFRVEIRAKRGDGLGQRVNSNQQSSRRLNSMRSVDSEEENIIEQINSKKQDMVDQNINQNDKIKPPTYNQQQRPPISPQNKIVFTESHNPSQLINHQKPLNQKRVNSQQNSLKGSQTVINNESDIANIANLLRENQHNLYFLPSITEESKRVIMVNNNNNKNNNNNDKNISDSDILRGLDYNYNALLLENESQGLPLITDKNINKRKQDNESQSDDNRQQQTDQKITHKQNYKQTKTAIMDGYLSITLNEIKLKKKDILLKKKQQGLKKLTLVLSQKGIQEENQQLGQSQYYFLTENKVKKLIESDSIQTKNKTQAFGIRNHKIDINNIYQLETVYSQGFALKVTHLNASASTDKNGVGDGVQQQLLVSGILPIQDIINVVEQVNRKMKGIGKVGLQQCRQEGLKVAKRKTMVLYSGRQVIGKAVFQVTVSNRLQQNVPIILNDTNYYDSLTTIQFHFKIKDLFKRQNNNRRQKTNDNNTSKPQLPIMRLSYCSMRNQQSQIEILPLIQQNQFYEIHLPQPIVEYQLILRPLQQNTDQKLKGYQQSLVNDVMSVSKFTQQMQQHNRSKVIAQQNLNNSNQQCVVPLQNLYFKKRIISEYPLIDVTTGRFVSSVEINLQILSQQQQSNNNKQQQSNYHVQQQNND